MGEAVAPEIFFDAAIAKVELEFGLAGVLVVVLAVLGGRVGIGLLTKLAIDCASTTEASFA